MNESANSDVTTPSYPISLLIGQFSTRKITSHLFLLASPLLLPPVKGQQYSTLRHITHFFLPSLRSGMG
jgi:hypothetical protein